MKISSFPFPNHLLLAPESTFFKARLHSTVCDRMTSFHPQCITEIAKFVGNNSQCLRLPGVMAARLPGLWRRHGSVKPRPSPEGREGPHNVGVEGRAFTSKKLGEVASSRRFLFFFSFPFWQRRKEEPAGGIFTPKWRPWIRLMAIWGYWGLSIAPSLATGRKSAQVDSDKFTKSGMYSGKHGWRSSALPAFMWMKSKWQMWSGAVGFMDYLPCCWSWCTWSKWVV